MIAVDRSDLDRCRALISEAPLVDPLALVEAFDGSPIVLLESKSGDLAVGIGETFAIEAHGPDRFEAIRRQAARVLASVGHRGRPLKMFGGFAFEETEARFVLPRWLYERSGSECRLTLALSGDEDPREVELERERIMRACASPPPIRPVPRALAVEQPGDYVGSVARALAEIERGSIEKVVLARRIRIEAQDRYAIAPVLAAFGRSEGAVRFAFGTSGAFFAGATPELLIAKSGGEAASVALAGSARPEAAVALLDSKKDRAEHGHVTEFVRATLERFAREVSVGEQALSRLAHVAHLCTPITANLSRPTHLLELAAALHPTPAVGGVPQEAARALIRELEEAPRGWYAGPVGWFDSEGDGELFVALRSARFDGCRADLFAGAGIVEGSDPHAEARETELKAKTVALALGVSS